MKSILATSGFFKTYRGFPNTFGDLSQKNRHSAEHTLPQSKTSMNIFRLASAGCHSNLTRRPVPGIHRVASSAATQTFDSHAIEAKWQAKWELRQGKKRSDGYESLQEQHPLSPLYINHLRPMSILDTLRLHSSENSHVLTLGKSKPNIFHKVLDLVNLRSRSKSSDKADLKKCIDKYGSDITRTYVVFWGDISDDYLCNERGILEIQQWSDTMWKATLLAHESYIVTQPAPPTSPNIPEALYAPNLEEWEDYQDEEPKSWVHLPPDQPDVFS